MSKELNEEVSENKKSFFALEKENIKFILIGFAIVVIGFMLMIGGGAESYEEFNEEELFSTRRITVAPLMVLIGYIVILIGIIKKPKA